mgnify:CR=1 FL=1
MAILLYMLATYYVTSFGAFAVYLYYNEQARQDVKLIPKVLKDMIQHNT